MTKRKQDTLIMKDDNLQEELAELNELMRLKEDIESGKFDPSSLIKVTVSDDDILMGEIIGDRIVRRSKYTRETVDGIRSRVNTEEIRDALALKFPDMKIALWLSDQGFWKEVVEKYHYEDGGIYKRDTGEQAWSVDKKTGRKRVRSDSLARWVWFYHYGFIPIGNDFHIDHIDGDRTNDRIENLQILPEGENSRKGTRPGKRMELLTGNQLRKAIEKHCDEEWGELGL